MTTATELGYKVGDQFTYNNTGAHGINWFVNGAIITLTRSLDSETPGFSGPALKDNTGGSDCKKGDTIDGWAKLSCVTPNKPAVPDAASISVRIEQGCTMFIVGRVLTLAERAAVFNLLSSQEA